MNVQIVYCHPSKKPYTYQILEQLKKELQKERVEFKVSDLYEMTFNGDMTEHEYNREGFSDLTLPILLDVQREHEKIGKDYIGWSFR